jgi:hypothetical protein
MDEFQETPEGNIEPGDAAYWTAECERIAEETAEPSRDAAAPKCSICDGSGILRVPEPDGSGLYETACPDPAHGDVTFPDPGPVTTPLSDWDW